MEPLVIRQGYVAAALREIKTNLDTGKTTWLFAKLAVEVGRMVNTHTDSDQTWNVSVGWTGDYKAGMTKFHPTEPTIVFSKDFLLKASIEQCLEVIYHEVAHAFAGEAAGHGTEWFKQCVRLGIMGDQYASRP